MSEHLIRLRGGWTWRPAGGGPAFARRLDLPTTWPADLAGPILLSRPFGRPPIDSDRDGLSLRLEGVAGLAAIRLNDVEVARPPRGTSDLSVELPMSLPARNVLTLEVDPAGWLCDEVPESAWGRIALVIRPKGEDQD